MSSRGGEVRTGAAWARLRHDWAMAWRRLATERAYSLIAIGGLALGLAGCLIIWGYVRYERGYDAWVPGADRVYQVQSSIRAPGQPEVHAQSSSYIIYDRLPADFPQVEAVTSLAVGKTVIERDGRPDFIEATTVDPSFFRVFPLPFLHGSPATALADTHSVVLSRPEAVRRFGTDDVLGRNLTLGAGDGRTDYRVGGVIEVSLRKVMGATRAQLVVQFLIEGVLVCAIATPFALAGLLALAIARLTVAGHAIRVARLNPIYALRYE